MGIFEFFQFFVQLLNLTSSHLVFFLPVHHEPADELADSGGEKADAHDEEDGREAELEAFWGRGLESLHLLFIVATNFLCDYIKGNQGSCMVFFNIIQLNQCVKFNEYKGLIFLMISYLRTKQIAKFIDITTNFSLQIRSFIIQYLVNMDSENPLGVTNSQFAQIESYQAQIKEIFQNQYQHCKQRQYFYTNIYAIARFSIAREFDRKKTIEQWRKWLKWYEEYRPDKITTDELIINKIHQSGKYRFCGKNINGCPILVIRMRYHIKGLATANENLRYLLYMIEKGYKLAEEAKTYQICVIFDRRNMADSDEVSKESMKQFMPILNDCYPELLNNFYVIGANFFYRAMWKVVSIFVSKRTEDKIHLLESVDELKKYITPQNLDVEYGGELHIESVGRIIPVTEEKKEQK